VGRLRGDGTQRNTTAQSVRSTRNTTSSTWIRELKRKGRRYVPWLRRAETTEAAAAAAEETLGWMGEIERTDTARVFIGDSSRVEWAGWARDSLDLINKVGEIGPVYILQKASSCHTYPQFWVRPAKKNIWVQHVLMLHPRFGHGIPSCSVGKSLNVGLSDFIWTSLTNAHVSGVERVGQYDEVSAQFVGDRERKKKNGLR
jgi:hypothetical protein